MAQQSVRRGWENQERPKRLERATATWTQSANSIRASGVRTAAFNRPDTRKHLDYKRYAIPRFFLHLTGRPHTGVR